MGIGGGGGSGFGLNLNGFRVAASGSGFGLLSASRSTVATPGAAMQESAFTSFGGGPIGFAYGKFQTTGLYNDVNGTLSAQTLHLSQFGGTNTAAL